MSEKKVCVVGLGYIGLPTAAIIASSGMEVTGVDINDHVIDKINEGEIHITEPDLEELVFSCVQSKKLMATTEIPSADTFVIAVPTPFFTESKTPDLSHVYSAVKAIAPKLRPGNLVILESTSPVGTTNEISKLIAKSRPDLVSETYPNFIGKIDIAYCPERVLPGKIIEELRSNDRIIAGITKQATEAAIKFYQSFTQGNCIASSSPKVAELAKLAENSFRDVNIAFANELSMIADELSVNVWELIQLTNRHPRVNILEPGPGVGGHCIAVDPWFVVSQVPKFANLIKLSREVNLGKPAWITNKILQKIDLISKVEPSRKITDIRIALYGLSYKANSDDLRESPSLAIAEELATKYSLKVYGIEPNIELLPTPYSNYVELLECDHALQTADIHVMLVQHDQFAWINRPGGHVIDAKGVWTSSYQ